MSANDNNEKKYNKKGKLIYLKNERGVVTIKYLKEKIKIFCVSYNEHKIFPVEYPISDNMIVTFNNGKYIEKAYFGNKLVSKLDQFEEIVGTMETYINQYLK